MGYDYPTLRTLVEELSEATVGGKVGRVLMAEGGLYVEFEGSVVLFSAELGFPWAFSVEEVPAGAGSTWEAVRGAVCREVILPSRDRVLEWRLEKRGPLGDRVEYRLVAELMPQGDVVLLDGEGRILEALRGIRSRGTFPGRSYSPPGPSGRLDPEVASTEEFRTRCLAYPDLRTALSKVLSCADVNTAEAVLDLSDVDPEVPPSKFGDWGRLLEAARELYDGPPEWGGYLILDGGGEPEDFLGYRPLRAPRSRAVPSLSMAISEVFERKVRASRLERAKAEVRRRLKFLLRSRRRRLEAIEEDMVRARRAEEFRNKGELLAANLHRVPKCANEVLLPSFEDPERKVKVELDPKLSPAENMARYFASARKAETALGVLPGRRKETLEEIARLEGYLRELEGMGNLEEVEEFRRKLEVVGLLREGGRKKGEEVRGFRRYEVDGWEVLVGRDGEENDRLLRRASPEDLWFHAYGAPGAHVVLRRRERKEPSAEVLEKVAGIAAYHSKAKTSGVVPVTCTHVKYLRRPKGARPGEVIVTRGRTLFVEPRLPDRP